MALNLLLLLISLGVAKGHSQYFQNNKYCDDLSPYYGDLDLDQIAGVWYGVEKIDHRKGDYRIDRTQECFYIDIKELYLEPTPPTPYPYYSSNLEKQLAVNSPYNTYSPYNKNGVYGYQEQPRMRQFVLEWHEGLWQNDYHIKVNTSHKGFWPTDVPNKSVEKMYTFFGGVIQVLKVANNHLVLNFCMRLPEAQLYSVVLSRNENQLTPEDLASIHNVFTLKNLSTSALKRVCGYYSSSVTHYLAATLVLATLMVKLII